MRICTPGDDKSVNAVYKVNVDHAGELRPHQRRRKQTQQRIVDAAKELVLTEGSAALSIKAVAARVDFTPGALYRYFDSKEALLTEVVSAVIGDVREVLEEARVQHQDPLVGVVAQCLAYRAFAQENPNGFALLMTMAGDPHIWIEAKDNATAAMVAMVDALAPVAGCLEGASGRGLLTPGNAPERAVLLFAGLQGVLQLRKQERMMPSFLDTGRLAQSMMRTLLLGFGAEDHFLEAAIAAVESRTPEKS